MKLEKGQKYSDKHGANVQVNSDVREKIDMKARNGELVCAVAFKIADELGVSPADIGRAIDLLDVRLIKCQLGLFGYKPDKKAVKAKPPKSRQLKEAIQDALVDGQLACIHAWDIASRFNVPKMDVSGACEALSIKIKPCQLGAF